MPERTRRPVRRNRTGPRPPSSTSRDRRRCALTAAGEEMDYPPAMRLLPFLALLGACAPCVAVSEPRIEGGDAATRAVAADALQRFLGWTGRDALCVTE